MRTPVRFRAETKYTEATAKKANKNIPIMAVVGTGDGATALDPNRANFYWIRLVNDNNRLTQCWCRDLALSYGDVIYVAKAKDEKLTFYEFVAFVQDAGGEPVPPVCPKFAQVVYVSANGCHFTTVGAAVTYINALAIGPAAGREFLVEVQAGTYIETAVVTIPQYVHLRGQGEATIINMGDYDLNFSDDTSGESFNITGTGDDQWQVIHVIGDNVALREIRSIVTGAGNADIYIESVTSFEAYHVVLETTQNTTYGFYFDDAEGLLWDCKVHDTSHWDYALFVDNLAGPSTVTTKYCEFRVRAAGYDVGTVAGSTWYHFACQFDPNNVSLAAGTHVALPTKRFNQEVIVAEEGGDFQALSEAITFINALGDAAADKLYGILMLGGNFAETGDVTVPQYVSVIGMGESTEIEMGAFTLFLDSNTSLENLVVESSDVVAAIMLVAEDNVVIRNVRCIQTAASGTPDCFYMNACTNVYLYHCIAEVAQNGVGYHVVNDNAIMYGCIALADTYSATTYGFQVSSTSSVELYYCIADDDTNFGDGLHIDDTLGCTCASWWCHFTAQDNDVNVVGVNATWEHFLCQFDPDNSTLAGTETPLVTGKANFDDVVTFEDGFTFDGASAANIVTVPDNVAQALNLVDAGGLEYMRVVSTNAQPEIVFNNGEADVNFRVAASGVTNAFVVDGASGSIGVNAAPVARWHMYVNHATTDPAATPFALRFVNTSTYTANSAVSSYGSSALSVVAVAAGFAATGTFTGSEGGAYVDGSSRGNISNVIGTASAVGTSGAGAQGNVTSMRAYSTYFGGSANTLNVTGMSGLHVTNPANLGWTIGTMYAVYIDTLNRAATNYALYSVGAAVRSYHAGTMAIGGTDAVTAQLLVHQPSASGAIPVVLLNQPDLSEEFIEFTTTVGAGNPIDTAALGVYYGKVRVNVTGVGYKVLALYEES